jgi:hypothetical protein
MAGSKWLPAREYTLAEKSTAFFCIAQKSTLGDRHERLLLGNRLRHTVVQSCQFVINHHFATNNHQLAKNAMSVCDQYQSVCNRYPSVCNECYVSL